MNTIETFAQATLEEIPGFGEIVALAGVIKESIQTINSINSLIQSDTLILQLAKSKFIYGPEGIIDPCNILIKSFNNEEVIEKLIQKMPTIINNIKDFIAQWVAIIPEVGPPIQVVLSSGNLTFDDIKEKYNKLPEQFKNIFQSPNGLVDKFNIMFGIILGEKLSLDHYEVPEEHKSGIIGNIFSATTNIAKKSMSIALTPAKIVAAGVNKLTNINEKIINYKNQLLPSILIIEHGITQIFALFFSALYIQSLTKDFLDTLKCNTELSEKKDNEFKNQKIIITDLLLTDKSDNNNNDQLTIINGELLNSIKKVYSCISNTNLKIVLSVNDINTINNIVLFNLAIDKAINNVNLLTIPNIIRFVNGYIDLSIPSYMSFIEELNQLNIKLEEHNLSNSIEIAIELGIISKDNINDIKDINYLTFIKLAIYKSMLCNAIVNLQNSFPTFNNQIINTKVFNGWFYKLFFKANILLFNNVNQYIVISNYDIPSLIELSKSFDLIKSSSLLDKFAPSEQTQMGGYIKFSTSFIKSEITNDQLDKANNIIISALIKKIFYGEEFNLTAKLFFELRDNVIYFEGKTHIQIIYDFIYGQYNSPTIDYFIPSKSELVGNNQSKLFKEKTSTTIHINIYNCRYYIDNNSNINTNLLEFNQKFQINKQNVIMYSDNLNLTDILLVISKEITIDTDVIDVSFKNDILSDDYISDILLTNTYLNFHGKLTINNNKIYFISIIGQKQLYLLNQKDFDSLLHKSITT